MPKKLTKGAAIERRDHEVAGAELAYLFDCSPRQIDLLAQAGIVVRVRRGTFDVKLSTGNYIRRLRQRASERGFLPEEEASNSTDYPATDVGQLRKKLERICRSS